MPAARSSQPQVWSAEVEYSPHRTAAGYLTRRAPRRIRGPCSTAQTKPRARGCGGEDHLRLARVHAPASAASGTLQTQQLASGWLPREGESKATTILENRDTSP